LRPLNTKAAPRGRRLLQLRVSYTQLKKAQGLVEELLKVSEAPSITETRKGLLSNRAETYSLTKTRAAPRARGSDENGFVLFRFVSISPTRAPSFAVIRITRTTEESTASPLLSFQPVSYRLKKKAQELIAEIANVPEIHSLTETLPMVQSGANTRTCRGNIEGV
jgi:hypothetical protein